jgi:hypothetical protein
MKTKIIITLSLVLVLSLTIISKERNKQYLSMKDLTDPVSPSFVPFPFPENDTKIIEDLKYFINAIYSDEANSFDYSLQKNINILIKFLRKDPGLEVKKIVKVKNCIAEMWADYSYQVILYDKETGIYARAALEANGIVIGFTVSSEKKTPVKPLKNKNEIIDLLSSTRSIEKSGIAKIELMAYDIAYASPICPVYQVFMKDGSEYFIDYNENIFKKQAEIPSVGDTSSFIEKERAKLNQDEQSLYDSINDKFIVLRKSGLIP